MATSHPADTPADVVPNTEIIHGDLDVVSSPPSGLLHHQGHEQVPILPPFLANKVVAELIATFMLVFVTCGAAALSKLSPGTVPQLGASVAGGLVVTVMIYAVGHISGAHMNPAVTFAFAISRHFPWIQVPFYVAAQVGGAMTASLFLRELLYPAATDLGTTTPSATAAKAFIVEVTVTFCMMFVTSAVATDTKAVGELAGLAVGSAVCITSILAGPISGGSMNPARTLGPAIVSNKYDSIWVYMIAPILGTILGAHSYAWIRITQSEEDDSLAAAAAAATKQKLSSFQLRRMQSQRETKTNNILENV